MGKILVTENELRNIISESVKTILKEDWKTRRNDKYVNANKEYANAQRSWGELSDTERSQWEAAFNNAKAQGGNYVTAQNAEEYYNQGRNGRISTAKNKLERATKRNGYQFQQDLQAANAKITNLEGTVASYQTNMNQIKKELDSLLSLNEGLYRSTYNERPDATEQQPTAQDPASGLAEIQAKIKAIQNKIKTLSNTITNQSQKIRNLTAAANQQKAPQATPQQANRDTSQINPVNAPVGQARANTNAGLQK